MKYLLGVNIGSQSIRVQLYDERFKNVGGISVSQKIDSPQPLWATQNASAWWPIVKKSIKELLYKAGISGEDVFSVGCTAHMHGVVPIGREGNLLQKDIQIYSDKRTMNIADTLRLSLIHI